LHILGLIQMHYERLFYMNILKTITILSLLSIFSYAKTNLLFYCGTTMVKPMLEIAKVIEKNTIVKLQLYKVAVETYLSLSK